MFLPGCKQEKKLFEKLSSAETGIDFTNTLIEDDDHNVLKYEYFYNGNGVAVGDVDNDGLADVFFTGNQTPSKLYLNKGSLHFEDVTAQAGVAGKNAWRTGVNMADVNGDGLLDIYVCYSGFGTDEDRANQLFINKGPGKQGVPSFSEEAAAYGLDAPGTYTSQSAFFDFDQDGDLDMFLLNHSKIFYSPFFNTTRLRNLRHPQFGNRLYRNDNGHFADISEAAGIYGSGINFGLGIAVSDLNNDGWPDILVSNDFNEQDFCYMNNRDGTFKEVCKKVFAHMSRSTMGIDIADYNNDLLPDVISMDMLPESNYRQKILQGPDEYDKYQLGVDSGYGQQNNRNMLQLHRGSSPSGLPVFSEVGQLAGVSNTDWSWAPLLADFDNDGYKDLFVTNGYLRDYTNLDFIKYDVAKAFEEAAAQGKDVSTRASYEQNMPLYELVKKMPSTRISNYIFQNKKDLTFSNESAAWGVDEAGISSGAAYTDLDNDGDQDLIVCNNNDPVWIYQNRANDLLSNNFIKIRLTGDQKNVFAVGAKVVVIADSSQQVQEMYPVRGYQSSMDYTLNFGIGKQKSIREVKVYWSPDSVTTIPHPAINTVLTITKRSMINFTPGSHSPLTLFKDVTAVSGIGFVHRENKFVDFKREFLIPYELSRQGPPITKGDVNRDGLEDFFVGGAAGQPGALYLQLSNGTFKLSGQQPWISDAASEDTGCLFFDADNDGDPDLYVVSGGNEWLMTGPELQDRMYENDGQGSFRKMDRSLPEEVYSGSCVTAVDFDKDGDLDLLVGARIIPGNYPLSAGTMLLRNDMGPGDHQVRFTDITRQTGGDALFKTGMVTDASWNDIDKDGFEDLIIVGDWMPVRIFKNEDGKKLTEITSKSGLDKTDGWWCRIIPADVDHDGDMDFIVGNLGANTQFKTSAEEPLITYVDDFNNDGKIDPILTWYTQKTSYPFNSRDELIEQMPTLNKKFLKYSDYASATIGSVITADQVKNAAKFYIYTTSTSLLINQGGKFTLKALPVEAQFSMSNAILYKDYDGDGLEDIMLAGNFYPFRVQQGRCDASLGCLLKGNGKGGFTPVDRNRSGLFIPGDTRNMLELKGKGTNSIVISKNDDAIQVLQHN